MVSGWDLCDTGTALAQHLKTDNGDNGKKWDPDDLDHCDLTVVWSISCFY